MTWRLFAVFFALGGVYGSTLQWDAPTVTESDCGGCSYGDLVIPVVSGPDLNIAYSSSGLGFGASSNSSVEDLVTIPSMRDWAVTITVYYSTSGTGCNDITCNPNWTDSGEFSGEVEIGKQVIPFSGSCFGASDCSASFTDFVPLSKGTFPVLIGYSDSNTSIGDSWTNARISLDITDPVAVPEPSLNLVLAFCLGLVVGALTIKSKVKW